MPTMFIARQLPSTSNNLAKTNGMLNHDSGEGEHQLLFVVIAAKVSMPNLLSVASFSKIDPGIEVEEVAALDAVVLGTCVRSKSDDSADVTRDCQRIFRDKSCLLLTSALALSWLNPFSANKVDGPPLNSSSVASTTS